MDTTSTGAFDMTVPLWVLLLFALWTISLLSMTIGVYRWSRILTGRATIREWRADEEQGSDRYRRAMRAHANCVENLPIYAAVVVALLATNTESMWLDWLAVVLLGARIAQSIIHIGPPQTELVAGFRFAFFAVQVLCMTVMGSWVAVSSLA